MGKRRSKEEILVILKEVEQTQNRRAVAAKHGTSESSIRNWEKKYVGESLSPRKIASIETEHKKLIKENKALKEISAEKDLVV